MATKSQLIRDLEQEAARLADLVRGIDERDFEKKRIDSRWGYREVVAHLTGWQGELAAQLKRAGATGAQPAVHDPAQANEIFADHARGKRRAQILDEFDHGIEHFVHTARSAPDDLFRDGAVGDALCRQDLDHIREHVTMVQQLRA